VPDPTLTDSGVRKATPERGGRRLRRTRSLPRRNLERALQSCHTLLTGEVGLNAGGKEGHYSHLLNCDQVVNLDLVSRARIDVQGDLHALPFEGESIDVILMTEVLEHLEEPWVALRECHRVLRARGLLVITTRFMYPMHDVHDYYRYTHEGLQHLLAPFDEVAVTALGNRAHVMWTALSEMPFARRLLPLCNPVLGLIRVKKTRWADGYLAVARRS
jgi:SAM-dependent methyltransferase